MSFFISPLGNGMEDPFFGSPMRSIQQMNGMMSSVFANPFGGMLQAPLALPQASPGSQLGLPHASPGILSPFGFPSFERMFEGFDMVPEGNSHSFSSSTVLSFSNGPDGRPQVYQASSSVRTAPGGIRETKKAVCDSRSGIKKLAIGHHIGERGHVLEREQNLLSGDQEERQDFINISEDEAEEFNKEFEEKAKRSTVGVRNRIEDSPRNCNQCDGCTSNGRHNIRLAILPSTSGSKSAALHKEHTRKREHEPEVDRSHKALKAAQNNGKNRRVNRKQ